MKKRAFSRRQTSSVFLCPEILLHRQFSYHHVHVFELCGTGAGNASFFSMMVANSCRPFDDSQQQSIRTASAKMYPATCNPVYRHRMSLREMHRCGSRALQYYLRPDLPARGGESGGPPCPSLYRIRRQKELPACRRLVSACPNVAVW